MAKYVVNPKAVEAAERLIDARRYLLRSESGNTTTTSCEKPSGSSHVLAR